MKILRHLLAIGLLPFVVTIVIPTWIARNNAVTLALGRTPLALMMQTAGAGLLLVGLVLFGTSLRRFASDGDGTLAPWDPPRRLVVRGPYRYVRNPMISGVVFILFGTSLVLQSAPNAEWAFIFLAGNLIHIPLIEEPGLRRRFGAEYDRYCRHVPRVVPRLTPWNAHA